MRKTRAVLLGTNAYPFLIRYWYELFDKVWQDEVDMVYIAVSKPEHESAWGYTKKVLSSHPKIRLFETNTDWPKSINTVVREVKEDLLFVPHDDTFIFKKGVLDKYFKIVEKTGKVVTPITHIFTPQDLVRELMKVKYPNQVPFENDEYVTETGYSFYCNFFFVDMDLMRQTSMDFGEWHVNIGEYEPLLDWAPLTTNFGADTNFKLCLELLRAGAEFYAIPKCEIATIYNSPEPLETLKEMLEPVIGKFDRSNGWIHLQTMAYHIYGLYFDQGRREALELQSGGEVLPLIHNLSGQIGQHAFKWDLTMKLAWIYEFMSVADYSGMQKYLDHTKKELEYIIKYVGLNKNNIKEFQNIFHKLIWGKHE